MKKLTSTYYSSGAFNSATLVLRLFFGILMMYHGYEKLVNFETARSHMPEFLGMSKSIVIILVIFAEFFCALFVVLGLFTRLSTIPIIILLCVILIKKYYVVTGSSQLTSNHLENVRLFLGGYLTILIIGPGKISVDSLTGK